VTEAFLPLLRRAAPPAAVLSTSSGVGARTLGLLSAADRALLTDPELGQPRPGRHLSAPHARL
jgi:hypothetical protein